jgi:hypothetical protein
MPRKTQKHQLRSKIAKKLKENGRIPPKPTNNSPFKMKKYPKTDLFIVLDLDQTLWQLEKPYNNCIVRPRPYAVDFVNFCSKIAKKVMFITGADRESTVRKLASFGRIPQIPFLAFENLIHIDEKFPDNSLYVGFDGKTIIKPVPGFDERTTIIVDDIPEFYVFPYKNNVIKIKQYKGQEEDNALLDLANFLLEVGKNRKISIKESIIRFTTDNPDNFYHFTRSSVHRLEELSKRSNEYSTWKFNSRE